MGEVVFEAFWFRRSGRSSYGVNGVESKTALEGAYLGPPFLFVTVVAGCPSAFLFFPCVLDGVLAGATVGP